MAVVIRMKRMGHKKAPYYRIVVADSRSKRDGKCIETVGTYHPCAPKDQQSVEIERAEYWISVGAQPTDTVWSVLKKAGIKKPVHSPKKKAKKEEKQEEVASKA